MASTVITFGNLSDVTPWNVTPFGNVTTINAPPDAPPWSMLEKLIFGTWLTISMLCAVFGNLMVVVVVIRHKGMRTRTNMFLVNLAVADFLVGLLLAPFALTTIIHGDWIFGDVICHINGFLNAVCFITSIHTLMYISIHKYVSITRPFSRILNHVKILIMIACAWLWAIICAVLTMFILSKVVYKPKTMQCGPEYPRNHLEYLHHMIIQITGIILPLVIMTFAYARMYCEFRQHAVRLRKNTTLQSDQILSQQLQVTKTLFIVLACFMLCWLPYAWYTTYVTMKKDKSQIPGWTNAMAYCFMYMNSGCNPIIYAWRSPSFREGYKQLLCQRPTYMLSDDTIRYSDSPGIIRRFSSMLHSSFRSTRQSMRRSSDGSSLNSPYISRSTSNHASSPSHTLLKRATSKTARDTIRYSDSPGIIRRFSSMLHSSFRSTRQSMRRSSDGSSLNSPYISRSTSNHASSPTHTLLKRATSKTARGSSVIRKDGAIIITKNGKIISVRRDTDSLQRDRTFSSFDEITNSRSIRNSVSKSVSDINTLTRDQLELSPLLKRDRLNTSFHSVPEHRVNLTPGNSGVIFHSPLSKIDSIDESKHDQPVNCSKVNGDVVKQQHSQSGEITPSALQENHDKSASPSTHSDLGEVFVTSPIKIVFNSQENMLNAMSLEPNLLQQTKFAKSDMHIDSNDPKPLKKNSSNSGLSKSSNVVFKVPLLRCPSVERLDLPTDIPRCSSEASSIGRLETKSPLYKRRWLSNKRIDQIKTSKT